MTTLYKPVQIESTEQAEALPGKTPILTLSPEGEMWESCLREDIDSDALAPPDGWTCLALVPIEAEEEWALIYDDGEETMLCADEADAQEWARIDGEGQLPSRRLVIPWEEA